MDKSIADAVANHPYAQLFATMPRIGTINLGQIIGEPGPILERSYTSEQFIAEPGVIPVTRTSGKVPCGDVALHGQLPRLPVHCHLHRQQWARQRLVREDLRRHPAGKKRHPYAARILAGSRLRVTWACWRTGTCYNPKIHRANNKINQDLKSTLAAQRLTQGTHRPSDHQLRTMIRAHRGHLRARSTGFDENY